MPKQKFEGEIDVPEGYKIKDFRVPGGEDTVIRVLRGTLTPVRLHGSYNPNPQPEFIIEKITQYRDPVLPADWSKKARFSDDGVKWTNGEIRGYLRFPTSDDRAWCSESGSWYKFCQVVDE